MSTSTATNAMRNWFYIAAGSLILAGFFAVLLVVGRAPGLSLLFTDPMIFKRFLVVHVDLSMVVWFYSFIAVLLFATRSRSNIFGRCGVAIAAGGIALLMIAAGITGAAPVLANYVPVIDHPLYILGLVFFGLGLILSLVVGRSGGASYSWVPAVAHPGVKAAAFAVVMAAFTFAAAIHSTPRGLPAAGYYELVMWGGGHVLQFASVALMLSVWLILLAPVCGPPMSLRTSRILFTSLVLPLCAAPFIALSGTGDGSYLNTFTRLMQFGMFPIVLMFLVLCTKAVILSASAKRLSSSEVARPELLGFYASAGLATFGFALGAAISGANTSVPGHYHASIGAVTAGLMAVTYSLRRPLKLDFSGSRIAKAIRWQPLLFASGQAIFALGFSVAGWFGMGRKTYAAQQAIGTLGQKTGLVIMSAGGLVAVCGGLLFLGLVIRGARGFSGAPETDNKESFHERGKRLAV